MSKHGPHLALLLLACTCTGKTPEPTLQCEDVSWESFTEPFLTTWCLPCHASTVIEADRRGAPLGVDFDTWEGAHLYADRISLRTNDEQQPMPPAGGPTALDQEAIARWVECGATGPASSPDPCAVRVELVGDATESGELCAGGFNAVTGSVHVSSNPGANLDCLCTIDGELLIDGQTTEVLLPSLVSVGGEIEVRTDTLTSLALPDLASAGAVRLIGAQLQSLDIDRLQSVDGLFLISGGRLPETFSPARLQSVGSHFGLSGVWGVLLVDLPRLERVGGDMVIEGMPSLGGIVHTSDLETIGGALRIIGNPSLGAVEDFGFLLNVFGDLEIGDNRLTSFDALWALKRVDGDLILRDEPLLETIAGFTDLEVVTGVLRVQRTGALELAGLDLLSELGGLEVTDNASLLSLGALPSLGLIEGDLVVSRNDSLVDLGNTGIEQIGGSLLIEEDLSLVSLSGLTSLESVGSDLTLRALPQLSAEQLEAFAASVDVGGVTVIEP